MRAFPVEPRGEVPVPPDRSLGRLGPALAWLGAVQGCWPPHPPRELRRVVLDGSGPDDAADDALEAGAALADGLADAGVDLVVLSCDADQVAGVVVAAALLDLEPVQAVGTAGSGDWAGLTVGVRDGLRTVRPHVHDPEALLASAGSPALSRAAGLLAQSAVRRTPVVLDGSPLVCGAALVAERLAPVAPGWWLAGQAPPGPAAAQALARLGLTPLLDLRLESALGGDLALAVLLRAVEHVGG